MRLEGLWASYHGRNAVAGDGIGIVCISIYGLEILLGAVVLIFLVALLF